MSQEPSGTERPSSEEDGLLTVRDDQLPDDVKPGEDNPLAEPAGDDVPDDVLARSAGHASAGNGSEGAGSGGDDASGTSSVPAPSESSPGSA